MIATPLNSKGKNKFGAKNYIVFGFVVLTLATFGTGLCTLTNNKITFLVLTCVLRFISGGADTMIQITLYNILTEMYKEDVNVVFRYMEIVVNVGYAAGPILGALVYDGLHYGGTMYLFGGLNGICLIFCIFMIPNSVNKSITKADFEEEDKDKDLPIRSSNKKEDVTWADMLSNRHVNFAMLTMVCGLYGTMFFSSFLGNELI